MAAQLLNAGFAAEQLALIEYEREGGRGAPFVFAYSGPKKALFVDIQYALTFREQIGVATKGEAGVSSRFGARVVVGDA